MDKNDFPRIDFFDLFAFTGPRLDVRWEPTPGDVVQEMLTIADVKSSDVVYDLGCGDGRIVIAAARDRGAKGIGVDLDPRRIKESNENALRADMSHAVTFINNDLFKTDFSDASVLMLFLFPDVNLRLRPKLLAELRPGTRIVSYCHSMEDWEPDAVTKVRKNNIYLWIVPANIGGSWRTNTSRDGISFIPLKLDLQQEFQRVTGTVTLNGHTYTIEEGHVKGTSFFCSIRGRSDHHPAALSLTGTVEGNVMKGTLRSLSAGNRSWAARRDPETIISIAR